MNKQTMDLETKLDQIYTTPAPDPAFANRLERTLIAKAEAVARNPQPSRAGWLDWLKWPAWNYALAVLVMITLIIVAAGPSNVLAKVKQLFAPGFGFVEPGVTRVLAAPVEIHRENITLRVETAIASPQNTQIALTVSGFPKEKFGPDEGQPSPADYPYLRLPDGTHLNQTSAMSGVGENMQATLDFPPLPKDVVQATLVLPRLPSLPASFAPQGWEVPLQFQVVGEDAATSQPVFPATDSYTPTTSPSSTHGVTAQVLQVGQSAEETGVEIQYKWNNPEWTHVNDVHLSLADETGAQYEEHKAKLVTNPGQDVQTASDTQLRTYRFEGFSESAGQADLSIEKINFTFSSQAHFTFDPSQNKTAEGSYYLSTLPGSQINIAGVPVQVLSATISPAEDNGNVNQPAHDHLEVLVQTRPQNGVSLRNISMSIDPQVLVSSSCEVLPDNQMRLTIDLPQMPAGPLTLYFPHGEVSVTGPWQFGWDLP